MWTGLKLLKCGKPFVSKISWLSQPVFICTDSDYHVSSSVVQILFEVKNAAHCGKFGEEIPPWS